MFCGYTHKAVFFMEEEGGGEERQAEQYVRRRQRQNITMGGQPAAPFEALRAEVLVVKVLSNFLQVLHVGAGRMTITINRQ